MNWKELKDLGNKLIELGIMLALWFVALGMITILVELSLWWMNWLRTLL